jgi:hypothetical protein
MRAIRRHGSPAPSVEGVAAMWAFMPHTVLVAESIGDELLDLSAKRCRGRTFGAHADTARK